MRPYRALGLVGVLIALTSCGTDSPRADPTAPSNPESQQVTIQFASGGPNFLALPDSVRAMLSGTSVRFAGGVGTPGVKSSIVVRAGGDTVVSEVTRGSDGRISRLRTIRGGVMIVESEFRTDGDVAVGTHRFGGKLQFTLTSQSGTVYGGSAGGIVNTD